MLRARGLTKIYRLGGQQIRALDALDLDVPEGDYLRIVGASGSGKSTLLNLIGGLDRPTSGTILCPLGDLASMSSQDLARWRARHVGMVFQTFNLIPHRSALQNVELGLLFLGVPKHERAIRARASLERVGLGARMSHRPADLSGGEQQRVALARALVKDPRLLLADEPTGNLDKENAALIANLLRDLHNSGMTVILVTHDPLLAAVDACRTIRMSYGRMSGRQEGPGPGTPEPVSP